MATDLLAADVQYTLHGVDRRLAREYEQAGVIDPGQVTRLADLGCPPDVAAAWSGKDPSGSGPARLIALLSLLDLHHPPQILHACASLHPGDPEQVTLLARTWTGTGIPTADAARCIRAGLTPHEASRALARGDGRAQVEALAALLQPTG